MLTRIRKKIERLMDKLGHRQGSLGRKVINSGAWVAASSVGINILTIIRSIVLARVLAPEVFGLMSICLVVIRGFEVVTQSGFGAALIHRQHGFEEAKDTAFSLMVARGWLLAIIVFAVAPLVADFYEEPVLDLVIQIVAISFIFNGFKNINTVAHEKDLDFRKLVYLEQLVSLLNTILVIVVAYYYRNVWALVVGHVATSFIAMFLSYIFIPGRPRLRFNRKIAWELFHYGKFITGVGIVLFIATEIDNVVVGKMLGMEALGFYYIAFMLANLPATHISKIASRVLFPAYSKLQGDLAALNEAYLRVLGLIGSIAIPAAMGLLILAHEIITLVYGVKWQAAVEPLQILCVLGGLRAITSLNGYLMNGIGKPNISFYIITFRVVLIAILIYPLTLYYGLLGAAVSVTIPMIIQLVISMLSLKRLIGLKLTKVLKVSGSILLRGLLMAVMLLLLKISLDPIDEYELVLLVFLGGGFYMVINRKQIFSFVKGKNL